MPGIPESMQRARYADECRAAGVFDQYEALLAAGNPPGFAAMLALQEPPGAKNTDRAFSQGQQRKMENMSPMLRGMLQKRARAAGIDTRGKYYVGGPFGAHDARSWVTSAEDLMTVAKRNNLNLEGVLNHKADRTDVEPKAKPAIAPNIVRQLERKALQADPALAERVKKNKHARHELRERLVEKHTHKKPKRSIRLG